jgi:cytidine deaminase
MLLLLPAGQTTGSFHRVPEAFVSAYSTYSGHPVGSDKLAATIRGMAYRGFTVG